MIINPPLEVPQFVLASNMSDHVAAQRPTRFLLPRPISAQDLNLIAKRGAALLDKAPLTYIHLIGIANSGVPLATALSYELASLHPDAVTHLSTLNINRLDNIFGSPGIEPDSKHITVLIDNSVHTGRTASAALHILNAQGVFPDVLVKLVDYEDALEREARAYISAMFTVSVLSLYTRTQVCSMLSAHSVDKTI